MVRTEKPQSRDPFTDGLLTFSPRKRQILEEAAKLIVKKGYAATSMNDIADQLGIRKASLYHHCKNKDEIASSIEALNYQYNLEILEYAESKFRNGIDKLRYFFLSYSKIMASPIGAAAVHIALTPHSEEIEERNRFFFKEVDQGVRKILLEGQADGSISDVQAKWLDFMLFGTLHWISRWYSSTARLTPDQLGEELFEALCHGLSPRV